MILSWHHNKILSKLKDFEDIHVPAYKDQLHFLGKPESGSTAFFFCSIVLRCCETYLYI